MKPGTHHPSRTTGCDCVLQSRLPAGFSQILSNRPDGRAACSLYIERYLNRAMGPLAAAAFGLSILAVGVKGQDATPAPANETVVSAPSDEAPAKKKEEIPSPTTDEKPAEVAATQETPASADQATAPAPDASAANGSATPAPESNPAATEPAAPAKEETASVVENPAPAQEPAAQPTPEASAPVSESPAPPSESNIATANAPAPADQTEPTTPAAEPVAPATEAAANVAEQDATPVQAVPVPAMEEPAPVASAPAPEVESAAAVPTPEPAAPGPEPVAQVSSESPTPIKDEAAPVAVPPTSEVVADTTPVVASESPAPVLPPPAPAVEAATVAAPTEAPTPSQAEVATTPEPAAPAPAAEPADEASKHVAQEPAPVSEVPVAAMAEAAPMANTETTAAAPTETSLSPAAPEAVAATPEAPAPASETPAPEAPAVTAETSPAAPADSTPVPPTPEMEQPVAAAPAESPTNEQEAAADSGVAVDRFEFSYGLAHPALPPLEELNRLSFQANRSGNVFHASIAGSGGTLTLGGIPAGSRFDADTLRTVAQEVVRWYNNRGLYGVWVTYRDIEASAAGLVDNRSADDNKVAHLVVWASQISEVRSLARGKRIKPQFSIDNRKHRRIVGNSPLKAGTGDQPGSLFNQEVLNNYLYSLSLHPGRRVEASIASAGEPGKVVLDYLVNESKAWQLFTQVNNYGTTQTGTLRGRIGYQDNQLTNHDDILNVDLISTSDLNTYGAFLSYRIPLWRPAKLMLRIYGSYGDYSTIPSDAAVSSLKYTGDNWQGGFELMNRLTLWRSWQFSTILGANYTHYGYGVRYGDGATISPASTEFLVPFIGTTVSHDTAWWSMSASVRFDQTVGDFANADPVTGYQRMGRSNVDRDWTSARWSVNGAIFLDSFFNKDDGLSGLAHELSGRVRGRQLLRGKRLPAQEQEPIGGALSVRGYPESVLAADETIVGSLEYAYHIPRGLKPADPGTLLRRPFKWHPTKAGQNPDWDLALRAFYDYGHRGVSPISAEGTLTAPSTLSFADTNFNISGAGVGVSFSVKQNFFLRADLGMAFTELRDPFQAKDKPPLTEEGNKQLSVVSTFIW